MRLYDKNLRLIKTHIHPFVGRLNRSCEVITIGMRLKYKMDIQQQKRHGQKSLFSSCEQGFGINFTGTGSMNTDLEGVLNMNIRK